MDDSPEAPLPITPSTRIGALLEAYPALERVLIEAAPMFERLRNPVLRRTVARVTTVERAAGIANLPVRELVQMLREGAGVGEPYPVVRSVAPSAGAEAAAEATPTPPWVEQGHLVEVFDADAMLDAGTVPLGPVLQRARELPGGQTLRLDASFPPTPLVEKARASGLACHVERVSADRFSVFIGTPASD